jgi:histidyl-tRNA synthetase
MSKVLPAKGFRDLAPTAKRRKEEIIAVIRDCYLRYGFDEIETPAVEPIERLRGSEGGENLAMIFEILRRGEDRLAAAAQADPADLGLRYDLTVPLARYYASNRATLPAVFRSIQIGPVWRAEKPQRGRYRQFTQCDIDILGERSSIAEMELILATLEALAAAGLPGATVKLNDRRLLDAALEQAGLAESERPRALTIIDKIDRLGLQMVLASLAEAFPGQKAANLERLLTGGSRSSSPEVEQILSAVRAAAGPDSIDFDPTLVRGMGYYTGPIFEVRHPAAPGSLAGGGRYDNMVGKFAGEPVPACGFSIGLERLLDILAADDAGPTAHGDRVALIFDDKDAPEAIIARQQQLLGQGLTVRLVRSARNKQRMFDELLRAGYGRVQHVSDDPAAFRELAAQNTAPGPRRPGAEGRS